MKEIKLVESGGRICGGAEAVVCAIRAGRRTLGVLARVYYVPGVRQAADRIYAWVARNRHRRFTGGA
jgi:predicted DCC family thiol-disulfide oxidoreductase YuxK